MIIRDSWSNIKQSLFQDEVIVITGPRQVGKTVTLNWLLSQIDSPNKYYIDLENVRNRALFATNDYEAILPELQRLGLDTSKKLYLALDEIQLAPQLPSIIKYLHDHYPIQFITTGSSSYYLKNLFSESMAGRKKIYELYPLSFGEFLLFKGVEYTHGPFKYNAPFSDFSYTTLQQYYNEYRTFGGFPKVVQAKSEAEKREKLDMIFSSYLQLDVQSLSGFKSLGDFTRLVTLLAPRVGNKINVSAFATILGISRQTVESYLSFMEQTYLIRLVQPYSASPDVRIGKAPKLYFIDTGIANSMGTVSLGAQLENTVCHQLFLHADTTPFGRKLHYYANHRSEIDFILNESTAFEVKETPLSSDLTKLTSIAKKIGIAHFRLIGNQKPSGFNDFLYGGMIS